MRIGLSQDFGIILYNLERNQASLANTATQLSSGLRINTAADDPSGLAIAEHLRTISNGLQQGINSIQEANHALTVADGGLATITNILQRVRTLIVEANSDLNSTSNLQQIQAEIDQLLLEINRISSNTTYNGKQLLDGSLGQTTPPHPGQLLFVTDPIVGSTQNNPNPIPLFALPGSKPGEVPPPNGTTTSTPGVGHTNEAIDFSFSIDSYDATANLLQVTLTATSPDPNFGPDQVQIFHVTPGTNFFSEVGFDASPYVIYDQNFVAQAQFEINNIDQTDVGKSGIFCTTPSSNGTNGTPLEINTGTSEGSTILVAIDATNTTTLGVNEISVGTTLTNQCSEARVDGALETINYQRAQLGAQMVSLNEASDNASNQYLNQVASESSIRDLNVGSAVSQFTREQILVQVGTSVLSQSEVDTRQLTAVLIGALVA